MKIKVFISLLFSVAVFNAAAQTQGYSNIENVGQTAFSILQNFSHTNKAQFSSYFYSNIKMLENLAGEKVPNDYFDSMYTDVKNAGIEANIKWENIKYLRIQHGRPVEESGMLLYKDRLWFKYLGKEYPISLRIIQYQGKYYLYGIGY